MIEAYYTIVDSELTVFGNIYSYADFDGNNRRYIAVVERHTYNNVSSNGETEFNYVEQKVLPNSVGVYLNGLTNGAVFPFSQTIDLRTVTHIENYDNLMFAVWVQNSAGDKNVRQAAWATFPTGVQNITHSSSGIVSISPNPSISQTMIQYQLQDNSVVSMNVVNSLGQVVYEKNIGALGFGLHTEMFDTENLAAGVYYIDMQIRGNHYRQPIVEIGRAHV